MTQDISTAAFEGHTSGPWEFVAWMDDTKTCQIVPPEDSPRGSMFLESTPPAGKDDPPDEPGYAYPDEELQANGGLAAAAPALLADRDRLAGDLATLRAVADGLAASAEACLNGWLISATPGMSRESFETIPAVATARKALDDYGAAVTGSPALLRDRDCLADELAAMRAVAASMAGTLRYARDVFGAGEDTAEWQGRVARRINTAIAAYEAAVAGSPAPAKEVNQEMVEVLRLAVERSPEHCGCVAGSDRLLAMYRELPLDVFAAMVAALAHAGVKP